MFAGAKSSETGSKLEPEYTLSLIRGLLAIPYEAETFNVQAVRIALNGERAPPRPQWRTRPSKTIKPAGPVHGTAARPSEAYGRKYVNS